MISFPKSQVTAAVTPRLCRTEPLLRHKSSKVRPRKPHPKGEGQGGAAFLKPAPPRRGLGEPQTPEPNTSLAVGASPGALRGQLPVKSQRTRPVPGLRGQIPGRDSGRNPGSQLGWTGRCSPSTSSAPSRRGQGSRRADAAPAAAPGQPEHSGCSQPLLPRSHHASLAPSRGTKGFSLPGKPTSSCACLETAIPS